MSWKTKTKQRRWKPIQPTNGNGRIKKSLLQKGMHFSGRGTRRSCSWLNTLWHISNGYRNGWTSRSHCNRNEYTQKGRNFEAMEDEMKAFLGITYHLRKTVGQQTNLLEMKRFKTSWQEQGFSLSYRIFTFPITTMTIKLIKRTKSILLSNIQTMYLLKVCQIVCFKVLKSTCASLKLDWVWNNT